MWEFSAICFHWLLQLAGKVNLEVQANVRRQVISLSGVFHADKIQGISEDNYLGTESFTRR